LANTALGDTPAAIHWDFVVETLKAADGLPQMIGLEIDPADLPPGMTPAPAPPLQQVAPETVPAAPVTPAAPALKSAAP
jgi:hypothetical protein